MAHDVLQPPYLTCRCVEGASTTHLLRVTAMKMSSTQKTNLRKALHSGHLSYVVLRNPKP